MKWDSVGKGGSSHADIAGTSAAFAPPLQACRARLSITSLDPPCTKIQLPPNDLPVYGELTPLADACPPRLAAVVRMVDERPARSAAWAFAASRAAGLNGSGIGGGGNGAGGGGMVGALKRAVIGSLLCHTRGS